MASNSHAPGETAGERVGAKVAERLMIIRSTDGSAATPPPFVAGSQPGNYRPTRPKFPAPVFSFQAAADEAGLSRIFAGQHTRLDHEVGQRLGAQVADFVLDHLASDLASAG